MSETAREHRQAVTLLATEAERARSGTGRLVLLRGATGTGRTTVLETATEDAAGHGMRVLRARCSPGEAARPCAVGLQLLETVWEFADLALSWDERTTAARLWRVLRSAADQTPFLVAVDDIHLADAASRRWLVESARHIDRLPILLAVTERSQYDIDPPTTGLADTLAPTLVRTAALAPLTPDSAASLVRSACPDASGQWVENCVLAGAGCPMLLRALLDDLADGRHPTVPATCAALYPGAYPAAVQWWLDSAGPATTEVARALAVLDEGWDTEARSLAGADPGCPGLAGLVAELAAADPVRVAGWLIAMSGLGLLRPDTAGRSRYAHPLLRDAVLTGVPATRRRAIHRATAETMLRREGPTEALARQLLLSEPVGAAWTLPVLYDAASLALRDERADDAVAFLRRALDEPLSDERRQRLLTKLGSLECAGRRSAAGIPLPLLRLPATPHGRARAAVVLGTAMAGRGQVGEAVDMLRSVGGDLADHPDLVRALQTSSVLLSDQDQTVRRQAYLWLSDTAAHSPDLVGTAGRALLVQYAAAAGLTSAQDAMQQTRALLAEPADPLTESVLVSTAAAVAQWADELDEAESLLERRLAWRRPDLLHPMHEPLLNVQMDIAAARGDYVRLLTGPVPPGPRPTNTHAHALTALVETGRPAEAQQLADSVDLRHASDSWELNRFLYARGALRAATSDPSGALHDFLECGRRQSAREVVSPVVTPWRTAAAECHLTLGRPREALALTEEELRLARVWNTPRTVGRSLSFLGMATGGQRGLDLAEKAIRLLRDAPGGTELVAALIAQGRQLTATGERTRARDCLREAAEHAERLGALRLLGLAEQALRDSGARQAATARTGAGSLTGSERRIAQLAADGHTNAEIAGLLHLARRTVETHLTSAYKKLGIRRRSELLTALAREAKR
jgi:DNA-binding CsgD family transcriptional regulator